MNKVLKINKELLWVLQINAIMNIGCVIYSIFFAKTFSFIHISMIGCMVSMLFCLLGIMVKLPDEIFDEYSVGWEIMLQKKGRYLMAAEIITILTLCFTVVIAL